uniref:Smr domain-containing protein n=1 Tax=Aureoumbra lagunensis TaxID=44058 RepID=A0A7S3NJU4_9STRA
MKQARSLKKKNAEKRPENVPTFPPGLSIRPTSRALPETTKHLGSCPSNAVPRSSAAISTNIMAPSLKPPQQPQKDDQSYYCINAVDPWTYSQSQAKEIHTNMSVPQSQKSVHAASTYQSEQGHENFPMIVQKNEVQNMAHLSSPPGFTPLSIVSFGAADSIDTVVTPSPNSEVGNLFNQNFDHPLNNEQWQEVIHPSPNVDESENKESPESNKIRGASTHTIPAPNTNHFPQRKKAPRRRPSRTGIAPKLFKQLNSATNATELEQALEQLNEPIWNPKLIVLIMGRLRTFGRPERSIQIFEDAMERGIDNNIYMINACISACERLRRWEKALDLLEECKVRGLTPTIVTYNACISACEKVGQWEKALEILNKVKDPDVITYNAAISACEKGGQWERALQLLDEIKNRGLEPSIRSYNASISACEKCGHWRRALQLLSELKRRKLEPTVITYNACISACEKGGQWERALRLLNELRNDEIEPDIITFSAAISACEKGGQWEKALDLFSELRDKRKLEPDIILFNSVISACEKGGQWERALDLLDELKQYGLKPDVITYSAAISACEKGLRWTKALELLDEVKRKGRPDVITYNAAMSACEKCGEFGKALKLFQEVRNQNRSTIITYNVAISALEKMGHWQECIQLLEEATKEKKLEPNVITYCLMISGYEVRGDTVRARSMFDAAQNAGFFSHVWHTPDMIDLHELPAPVAKIAVRTAIERVRDRRAAANTSMSEILTLITGRGSHSEGGESILKPVMTAMLDSTDFSDILKCREDEKNPGKIHLTFGSEETTDQANPESET